MLVVLLAPFILATPPIATKAYYSLVPLQSINLVQFKVDFDQQVYFYQKSTATLQSGSSISGITNPGAGGNAFPNLAVFAQNLVSINCTSSTGAVFSVPSTILAGNAFPSYYLTAPPISDPTSGVINALIGGLNLNETVYPNRYAVILPLSGASQAFFTASPAPTCLMSFNSANDVVLTNANNEQATAPISLSYSSPQCSYQEVLGFQSILNQIQAYGTGVKTLSQISQITALYSILSSRDAYSGCKSTVNSLLSFGTVNTTSVSTQCNSQLANDPCCPGSIASFSQCCYPRSVTVSTTVITSVQSDAIAAQCQSPTPVTALLLNLATAQAGVDATTYDTTGRWSTLQSFVSGCYISVFSTSCQADADCPYSGSCNLQSSQCAVDFTNPGPPLVKCLLAKAPVDLKLELKRALNVPTVFATTDLEVSALTTALLAAASSQDCVGPTAASSHSSTTYAKDSNGNYNPITTPGNQTSCLIDKACSYQPWTRTTQALCSLGNRTGFCGQSQVGSSLPITQFSKCQATVYDATSCSNVQGSWESYSCNLPLNSTTCQTGPMCSSGNSQCSNSICYDPTITTSASCTGSMVWDTSLLVPACRSYSTQSACAASGYTFAVGRTYINGLYESAATCPSSTCNYQEVTSVNGPASACYGLSKCSAPCSSCVSYTYPTGACLDLTATSQSLCQGASGIWNTQGASGACLFNQYNQTTCPTVGKTWSTCSSLAKSDCGTSVTSAGLQCSFSNFAPCATAAACAATGSCDDFEYGSSQVSGVCVYTPTVPFKCNNSDMSTRAGTCINSLLNSNTCVGGTNVFTSRATDAASCAARGAYCISPTGAFSVQNATSCAACGGTSKAYYKWSNPVWANGTLVPTTYQPVQWQSKNQWITTLDNNKLQSIIQSASARIMAREILNKYNLQYNLYSSIFAAVSCDCISKNSKCFSNPVISLIGSCSSDPSISTSCNGVQINAGVFPSGGAVTISASLVSLASYVNAKAPNKQVVGISKASTGSTSAYAVVTNTQGVVIGQLIGNGKQYTFSTAATAAVQVCLAVDSSIPQDTTSYTILDFVSSSSSTSTLSAPMALTITSTNGQLCGNVPAFTSGTYFPILRNSQLSSTTTTTTTATPASSAVKTVGSLVLPIVMAFFLI